MNRPLFSSLICSAPVLHILWKTFEMICIPIIIVTIGLATRRNGQGAVRSGRREEMRGIMNWTMKHILPIALVFSMSAAAYSQSVDVNSAAAPSIPYGTLQVIGKDDSPAVIAEKAVKVLPRPNQTAWMRMERTFFLHYGPNTFRGVEWGNGRENPSVFNPTAFDAEQWMRHQGCQRQDAGPRLQALRRAVLVANSLHQPLDCRQSVAGRQGR